MVRFSIYLCIALFAASALRAQEAVDDLAVLPPMPNLYLGDPERPLSRKMRRALELEEERKRRAEQAEKRRMEERKRSIRLSMGASEPERDGKLFDKPLFDNKRNRPVTNSITSLENATTADGTILQPFGEEEDYWGGIAETTEDPLVELPPMPDLRTPDQVTRLERKRNKLTTEQKVRNLTSVAKREKRERKRGATVVRPQTDPDLALVQVDSERGAPAAGYRDQPETIRETPLKPFNEESAYYRDGLRVFSGGDRSDRRRPDRERFRLFGGNKDE